MIYYYYYAINSRYLLLTNVSLPSPGLHCYVDLGFVCQYHAHTASCGFVITAETPTKYGIPLLLSLHVHQRRIHDGNASSNPRPEPRGDPCPLQRWAADACDYGGLHTHTQEDLQIRLCCRPGKVWSLDGRVWVSMKNQTKALKGWLAALKIMKTLQSGDLGVCVTVLNGAGNISGIIQGHNFPSEDWCLLREHDESFQWLQSCPFHIFSPCCWFDAVTCVETINYGFADWFTRPAVGWGRCSLTQGNFNVNCNTHR